MPHIWMSHVTHMPESCHTYKVSHVTCMNESCHTYECIIAHAWMSHATHINESCHMYEWVMSHVWMHNSTRVHALTHLEPLTHGTHKSRGIPFLQRARISHMTESCHTYEWVMAHLDPFNTRHKQISLNPVFVKIIGMAVGSRHQYRSFHVYTHALILVSKGQCRV